MDDPDAGVGMAVNAALVALGEAEGALQVQIVAREVGSVAARE